MPSKRHLVLAATATTLGIGGMLLPSASAMAASTPDQSTTITAPASPSTTTTTEAPSTQPGDYCEWVYIQDAYGNWVYAWECYPS